MSKAIKAFAVCEPLSFYFKILGRSSILPYAVEGGELEADDENAYNICLLISPLFIMYLHMQINMCLRK
jgi:hypothetical protein